MKRIILPVFILLANAVFALQNTAATSVPVEQTKAISYWWWVIGVVLAIAGGMLLYVLIKKDPKKDAV